MLKNFKVFIIFISCLLLRLVPFRAPNVEPIMSSLMPISRKYGVVFSFLFGFFSIFIYDALTHFGSWTFIAGITYGFVGVAATLYFKKYKTNISNFVIFSVFATLAYDLITGVFFAPMFGQNMMSALALQIPFTALHLAGNIGLAMTLSPLLNSFLVSEKLFGFDLKRRTLVEVN